MKYNYKAVTWKIRGKGYERKSINTEGKEEGDRNNTGRLKESKTEKEIAKK